MSRTSGGHVIRLVLLALSAQLIVGCSLLQAPLLNPQGPVALAQRDLLFTAASLMLIVVVPVFVLIFWFAFRYRATRQTAVYAPVWGFSVWIDAVIWLVPALIVIVLGALVWTKTHRLDPYRPVNSTATPLEVEVVALDWKWLFIYPQQNIASVNELVFPSATPLSLNITSDTVMNAFFIPALGGQIYAMAGMRTRLNLMADTPGRFRGHNAQYSGDGFSDQHFAAVATTQADFEAWVAQVRRGSDALDSAAYRVLARPSIAHPITHYGNVAPSLFDQIIAKYASDTGGDEPGLRAGGKRNDR